MEKPRFITRKLAVGLAAIYLGLTAGTAWADWRFEGGEGTYYAFITDGGFVDGSYQNSLMFFCPDDGRICELYVTIDGETPQRNVVVTLAFQDGQTFQRLAEEVKDHRRQPVVLHSLVRPLRSNVQCADKGYFHQPDHANSAFDSAPKNHHVNRSDAAQNRVRPPHLRVWRTRFAAAAGGFTRRPERPFNMAARATPTHGG